MKHRVLIIVALGSVIALLSSLGVWQLQRLAWKNALIEHVNTRIHAPPAPAPDVQEWPQVSAVTNEYQHVRVRGHFLYQHEVEVYALTDYGPGVWLLTPFQRDNGTIIFVNRGFIPTDQHASKSAIPLDQDGQGTLTGLLRMSETKGWLFSQANDPGHNAWYRRDVKAMATSQDLGTVAPYFIDADAATQTRTWPKAGLTKVKFANSHLVYALTWFALAIMLCLATVRIAWQPKHSETSDHVHTD